MSHETVSAQTHSLNYNTDICSQNNNRVPTVLLDKKFQHFSRTVITIFPGPSQTMPKFKDKDKQQSTYNILKFIVNVFK